VHAETSLSAKYRKLLADFQKLELEYEKTKRSLEIREIEVRAILAQAHELANTDVLTFLPNRRKILSTLQEEVIRSDRYGTPLSVSILDLDHFKNVNDTYGHTAGDQVLRSVAARLRTQIRHPDTIGRYGGEEFLIVLPNSEMQAAVEQASRLCQVIRKLRIDVNEHIASVTISVGVAQFKVEQETWEELLHRADEALYRAKEQGRNRWAVAE
jgi:diguanylate cyclase (GGDEF)-like protein